MFIESIDVTRYKTKSKTLHLKTFNPKQKFTLHPKQKLMFDSLKINKKTPISSKN